MTHSPLRVCIVGASGKLGRYMIRHCLDLSYEVVGVCRPESVGKLANFAGQIRIEPGRTDDREVIGRALRGCDGVLTVLVPWGVHGYSTGTAAAVLDLAEPHARLVFSCGWHISQDGKDRYKPTFRAFLAVATWLFAALRIADIGDQVRACERIFASGRAWTVVRGSDLEEGDAEGLPVWSEHIGDAVLTSNRTRRVDFARFMVHALTDDGLLQKVPAIVSCKSASALAHIAGGPSARSPA